METCPWPPLVCAFPTCARQFHRSGTNVQSSVRYGTEHCLRRLSPPRCVLVQAGQSSPPFTTPHCDCMPALVITRMSIQTPDTVPDDYHAVHDGEQDLCTRLQPRRLLSAYCVRGIPGTSSWRPTPPLSPSSMPCPPADVAAVDVAAGGSQGLRTLDCPFFLLSVVRARDLRLRCITCRHTRLLTYLHEYSRRCASTTRARGSTLRVRVVRVLRGESSLS